jgi:hypothetical protein
MQRALEIARVRRGDKVSSNYFERRTGFSLNTAFLIEKGRVYRRVGRPPNILDEETLELLNDILRSSGPNVGLPSLRALLPWASKAALERRLRKYKQLHRRRRTSILYSLNWTLPGAVWAADLSHAPRNVDSGGPFILAVRDLASGYTVAWTPIPRGTGEEVSRVMTRLFRRHSAPVVLKTDNGSCFISRVFRELLGSFKVAHLRSPRAWPEYNGACEAGIGALRETTESVSASRGDFYRWTLESLEEARERLNDRPRPRKGMWTAADLWTRRRKLSLTRKVFQRELRIRTERSRLRAGDSGWRVARLRRKAIEGALRCFGWLRVRRRVVKARCEDVVPTSYL